MGLIQKRCRQESETQMHRGLVILISSGALRDRQTERCNSSPGQSRIWLGSTATIFISSLQVPLFLIAGKTFPEWGDPNPPATLMNQASPLQTPAGRQFNFDTKTSMCRKIICTWEAEGCESISWEICPSPRHLAKGSDSGTVITEA